MGVKLLLEYCSKESYLFGASLVTLCAVGGPGVPQLEQPHQGQQVGPVGRHGQAREAQTLSEPLPVRDQWHLLGRELEAGTLEALQTAKGEEVQEKRSWAEATPKRPMGPLTSLSSCTTTLLADL